MNVQFSEDMWERLSALWRKEKKQADDQVAYSDPQVRHLLKVMFASRRAMKEKQEFDAKEAWRAIEKRTASRRLVPVWCRYAAAVVVLGVAVWFWNENRDGAELPVAVNCTDTIRPGSQKAELILASGERIILDTHTETREITGLGVVITNDTSGGRLRYEAGSMKDSMVVEYNTLIVPKGGEYSLILPDGSQVWLNSETTLRFPVQFAENKREVQLEGEAFFKVQKNVLAPFHVYTENGAITVLGTSFNVSTYREDKYWQTTLVEGSVRVSGQGKTVVLKPSEQYSVDRITGRENLVQVDPEMYTSWVEGKFYFKAYTFEEIVRKLERWYDFTMVYQDETVKQMRFTGTINKHRSLTETLRFLEMTTDIRFKAAGKKITVSKI